MLRSTALLGVLVAVGCSSLIGCSTSRHSSASSVSNADLVLETWRTVAQEDGYLLAEGAVTNVSDRPLAGVTAMIKFFDDQKQLIFTQEAYLDTSELSPGATTTFRLETLEEVQLDTTSLHFISRSGQRIPTVERERYNQRRQ